MFTAIDMHWPKAEHLAEFIDFLHLVQDETGQPDGMLEFSVWRELGVGGPPSGRLLGYVQGDPRVAAAAQVVAEQVWSAMRW